MDKRGGVMLKITFHQKVIKKNVAVDQYWFFVNLENGDDIMKSVFFYTFSDMSGYVFPYSIEPEHMIMIGAAILKNKDTIREEIRAHIT